MDQRLAELTAGMDPQGVELVELAFRLATRAHAGAKRLTGHPYIDHPIQVALMVRDTFGVTDPEVIAAALLHDTVEDTWVQSQDIHALSPRVGQLVDLVTNPKEGMTSEERRVFYLSIWPVRDATVIKICDRLCNLRDAIELDGDFAAKSVLRAQFEMLWPGSPCLADPKIAELLTAAVDALDIHARNGVRPAGTELAS